MKIKDFYRFLNPQFQNLFLEYKVDLKPRYGYEKPAHQDLYRIINSNRDNYKELIVKALNYKEKLWTIHDSCKETDSSKPTWNNGFLPGLDIIGIYTIISEFKPKKYIEIGSGNSTKVAFKAKIDQKLNMEIVSIDPKPRAEIDSLANKVIRVPFENTDFHVINELNENDILFVDNSHRILPNSDSMVFYLEILPKLKKGVKVYIHDIYLPYDYPQFMCDRFYSEQYGLAIYLLADSKKYEPLLPNYFIFEDKELSKKLNLSGIIPIWKKLKSMVVHFG